MRPADAEPVKKNPSASDSGFSLIELLIVVAIILIISAIAIPNFLRSRMAANESSAVQSMRSIVTASVAYSSTYGNGYAPTLGTLGGPAGAVIATCDNALLLDDLLSNNGTGNTSTKGGYTYSYLPGAANPAPAPGCAAAGVQSFQAHADPVSPGFTGQRRFYTDVSGIIRFTADGTMPSATSAPLQ